MSIVKNGSGNNDVPARKAGGSRGSATPDVKLGPDDGVERGGTSREDSGRDRGDSSRGGRGRGRG